MKEKEDDGIIIYSKGLNGNTVFSVYTENKRIPILTGKNLQEISKEFIRLYPDESKKIGKFYNRSCSGLFPENVNISMLEPSPRNDLLQEIAKKIIK